MDFPLIITIALMVFFAAIFAGLWARRPGVRPVMGGLGLVLIPLGLWLLGVTDLAYNGVVSIIDWAQRTVWTTTMTWGVSLAGAGLVIFLISRFVTPAQRKVATKPEDRAVASAPSQSPATYAAPRPGATASSTAAANQSASSAPQKKTAEDAEVEDILRKRGLL